MNDCQDGGKLRAHKIRRIELTEKVCRPAYPIAFWGEDRNNSLARLTLFGLRKRKIFNDSDSWGLAVLIYYDRRVGVKF